MAKISSYPLDGTITLDDKVIGSDSEDNNATKNYSLSSIVSLFSSGSLVPYTGATSDVDLGAFGITANEFIKDGGTSSQFLKADGSVDSNTYLTTSGAGTTYVPYTGATSNVNLGSRSLSTTDLTLAGKVSANGSFGSAGNILVSQGSGLPAVWQEAPAVVSTYYGSFYDTTDQTVVSGGIAAFKYNTTVEHNGVDIVNDLSGNPTRITFANAGTYNIMFSAQLQRLSGGASKQTVIWLRLNGVDVPYSATHLTVQANATFLLAAWNFFQPVTAGQYVEIMWTQDDSIDIVAEPANLVVPYPATPSIILTVNKVS